MNFIALFVIAILLSAALVPLVKKLAFRIGAVDVPNSPRKIHKTPTALFGGLAIFLSFFIVLGLYILIFQPDLNIVPMRFYVGMFVGGLILMIGGLLDDKYNLPNYAQIIFPVAATIAVILSGIGIGITFISNPFGAPFDLSFKILGLSGSVIFIFIFVLGMIYTTKFLDGLDGLSSGISVIASATLFFLSLAPTIEQNITASIAIILCGAILGFWFFNFNPATIFLGESGSTFLGFMLAVISVLLGAKIATAVLVMGIPILDVAWVIVRRLWFGTSPFKADRKHLHFRLLDLGFTQRQTVLTLYAIALAFGFVAVFLQSMGKLISMIILLLVMLSLAIGSVVIYKKREANKVQN